MRQPKTSVAASIPRLLAGHAGKVYSCSFSSDGDRLVSASQDGTLKIWDAATGSVLRTLTGHDGSVLGCAFSPDGRRIVSAGQDGTIRLWDAATGSALRTIEGHAKPVNVCAFSPDGKRIVSASDDRTLGIWDPDTGAALFTLTGHTKFVWRCSFSPDGSKIASTSGDGTLRIWNAADGFLLHILPRVGPWTNIIYDCAFSPDGRRIVSAGADRTPKVWDTQSGNLIRALPGNTAPILACAFSPDGQRIGTGCADGTLKLWKAETGVPLRTLTGSSAGIYSCVFSPDSQRIVAAADDGALRVWEAQPTRQESAAAAREERRLARHGVRLRRSPAQRQRRRLAAGAVAVAVVVAGFVLLAHALGGPGKFAPLAKSMNTYVAGYSAKHAQDRREGVSPNSVSVPFRVTGPVVVVSPGSRQLEAGVMSALPPSMQTTDPAKVGLIVWIDRYDAPYGNYQGGGTAYQSVVSFTFIASQGGQTVRDEEDLDGDSPPGTVTCGGGGGCNGYGDPVTDDQIAKYIVDWINSTPN